MSRALFIQIHLYLSAFFSVAVILVATSGGLYLLGMKGSVETTRVAVLSGATEQLSQPSKANVLAVLEQAGVTGFDFDYVKKEQDECLTFPDHHHFSKTDCEKIIASAQGKKIVTIYFLTLGYS